MERWRQHSPHLLIARPRPAWIALTITCEEGFRGGISVQAVRVIAQETDGTELPARGRLWRSGSTRPNAAAYGFGSSTAADLSLG